MLTTFDADDHVVRALRDGASGFLLKHTPPAEIVDASTPGSGLGLIGLVERAELIGGRLEHEASDGDFVVRAWLPWPE